MKKLLIGFLVLAVLGAAAIGGVFMWAEKGTTVAKAAPGAPEVTFAVEKGTTARALGPKLQSEGLIDDARLWRFHLWRRGGLALKAGRFKLSASMTIAEMAKTLEGPPLPEDVPFAMIEGWRLRDTDAALAAEGAHQAGRVHRRRQAPRALQGLLPAAHAQPRGLPLPGDLRRGAGRLQRGGLHPAAARHLRRALL